MSSRTVLVNGKSIVFEMNKTTFLHYKREFKRNVIKDLDSVQVTTEKGLKKALEKTIPQLLWALVKTADLQTPRFKEWVKEWTIQDTWNVMDDVKPMLDELGGGL